MSKKRRITADQAIDEILRRIFLKFTKFVKFAEIFCYFSILVRILLILSDSMFFYLPKTEKKVQKSLSYKLQCQIY